MTPLETVELPNVRKMFAPDPGYLIIDCDLAGADAQVVAWEANDTDLKAAFRAGIKIHLHNAEAMWGDTWSRAAGDAGSGPKGRMYKAIKTGVHLTNYGGSPRTMAVKLGWTIHEAETFQRRWFSIHPALRDWHRRVLDAITPKGNRYGSIANQFGFRWTNFDRPDNAFTKALAWVPQSTVALASIKGAIRVAQTHPMVEFLLQVHDSLVFQIPQWERGRLPAIVADLHQPIPYPDLLTISLGAKTSERSWGECH